MVRKFLKWFGIGFAGIVGLLIVVIVGLYKLGSARVNKTYAIEVAAITVPTDATSVERGRHLVESLVLCSECHGEDLSSEVQEDDPVFGIFAGRNLTSGERGIGGTFTDADYVRAIRHGVGSSGKAIPFMPSEVYHSLSDADLGALIAYLRTLPPVDNELPRTTLRVLGRILAQIDGSLLAATVIDHAAPRATEPEPGPTREYGEYLTFMCTLCHGENLSGGTARGGEPNAPLAPNLTPRGELQFWTESEFFDVIRTGTTPGGRLLDDEFVPWQSFGKMTDSELRAIWLYLNSLAPREFRESWHRGAPFDRLRLNSRQATKGCTGETVKVSLDKLRGPPLLSKYPLHGCAPFHGYYRFLEIRRLGSCCLAQERFDWSATALVCRRVRADRNPRNPRAPCAAVDGRGWRTGGAARPWRSRRSFHLPPI